MQGRGEGDPKQKVRPQVWAGGHSGGASGRVGNSESDGQERVQEHCRFLFGGGVLGC